MSNILYTTIHMHYYYSKINSGTSLWRVCYCVSNCLPLARWIEQISGAIVVHCSLWHPSMQPPQWLAIMVITWQRLNMTQKESCTFCLAFKWLTFLFNKLQLVQLEFQAGSSSGSTVVADEQDIRFLFPGLILFQPCSLACFRRSVVAQVVYSQPKDSHTNSKKAPSTVCLSLRIKSPAWMISVCACACAIVFGAYSKLMMCRVHTGCYLIGCTRDVTRNSKARRPKGARRKICLLINYS